MSGICYQAIDLKHKVFLYIVFNGVYCIQKAHAELSDRSDSEVHDSTHTCILMHPVHHYS